MAVPIFQATLNKIVFPNALKQKMPYVSVTQTEEKLSSLSLLPCRGNWQYNASQVIGEALADLPESEFNKI